MTTPAIQTYDLTRKYGELTAVDHLALNIAPGEIFAFLGHNGTWKTTTISVLTTLLLPTAGNVRMMGYDVVKQKTGKCASISATCPKMCVYITN